MSATEFFQKRVGMQLPPYWKLAVFQVIIFAAVAGGSAFNAGTDGYQNYSDMTDMAHHHLWVNVGIAVGNAWLAFVNQTLSRAGGSPLTESQVKTMISDMTKPN